MADFQQHKAAFDELGATIVALSSDPQDSAGTTVTKLGLAFPVAYGLDAAAASRAIGCYTGIHEGVPHVQPAAFVLDGSGNIIHAVYSSGKVGRLTADDALTLLRDQQKKRGKAAP
ncbi:hypothetical protein BH11GEM1_BH11GEM1_21520 [soil metagenome]